MIMDASDISKIIGAVLVITSLIAIFVGVSSLITSSSNIASFAYSAPA